MRAAQFAGFQFYSLYIYNGNIRNYEALAGSKPTIVSLSASTAKNFQL
jgi:hypothetical protein